MSSTVKPSARPLSPHLQVYRLPLAAVLSITHRIAGIGLTLGILLLAWWVTAAAYGPNAYDWAMGVIGSWFGLIVLFGFSAALFFHLCNGVRHLVWDTGRFITNEATARSNVVVLIAAAVLTAVTWFLVLA